MSDPFSVLIVDDEPPVIEGLKAAISRELPEFYVVGSATNGREAIESARALQPDVILLDVQMPGIDGIEALRTMRSQGIRSLAILVTAYERFDVARRGYGLGVREYLVKPVGPRTIRTALETARDEIEAERERHAEAVRVVETRTQMLRIVEGALLHLVLAGAADSPIVTEILRYLCLDGRSVLPLLVRFEHDSKKAAELAERLRYTVHGPVGQIDRGVILALAFDVEGSVTQYVERITQAAESAGLDSVQTRAGEPQPIDAATEGLQRLVGLESIVPDSRLYDLRAAVVRAVQSGDSDLATQKLDSYMEAAAEYAATVPALEALLVTISDAVGNRAGANADIAVQAILEARRAGDPAAIRQAIRRRILGWIDSSKVGVNLSSSVAAAMEIMRAEFRSDLSIEEIADRLAVSSSHLSRLFSAELGQPPSAYLTDVRIRHATELLEQGDLSIKEIAAQCGYRDPNYFSRAFRTATGQSPSDFSRTRRKHGAD